MHVSTASMCLRNESLLTLAATSAQASARSNSRGWIMTPVLPRGDDRVLFARDEAVREHSRRLEEHAMKFAATIAVFAALICSNRAAAAAAPTQITPSDYAAF